MKKIIYHHGSPGVKEDFNEIINDKNENYFTDRLDKIDHNSIAADTIVGYSFGSVHAIKQASILNSCKDLILIAPYFGRTSKAITTIAKIPIVSDMILGKKAETSILEMIRKSSLPKAPTQNYQNMLKTYSDLKRLKFSLIEKDVSDNEIENDICLLKNKNINLTIIIGDHDQEAIKAGEKLKNLIPSANIHTIKDAGHALLYTHGQELTNITNKKKEDMKKFGYYEGESEYNNVASFLEDHLKKIPHKKILSWIPMESIAKWNGDINVTLEHQSVSVAELNALVGKIAAEFKKLGIEKGDRAIVFVPMSLYLYAAMFALQKIGAIAVFLDSWARRDQMGVAAEVVDAKAMISVEKAFMYLNDVEQIAKIPIKVSVGPTENNYTAKLEHMMQSNDFAPITPVEKEHTALITFTTGSSGTPKGADRSHRFLAAQHYALNRHLPYEAEDADLPVFPIFSLNNLAAGANTILPAIDVGMPNENDAKLLVTQLRSSKTTCTTLSPSLLRGLYKYCNDENIKLDFIRRIITGGAPVSKDDMKETVKIAPNAEILILYGSTEVEPMAHIEAKEWLSEKEHSDPEIVEEGVNVGHFDEGLEVKFLKIESEPIYINSKEDWKNVELPKGSIGEIIVAGEHVCERYFNNEEAFFRAKIKDENGKVWHRTGDLGKIDSNNNLWLVGRVHNAINRNGTYMFPVRAEIVLKKLEFVKKAAFLGVPDKELGEKTYAVYSPHAFDESLIEDQKREVKRILDKNQIIADEIVCVDDIPMDPRHHSKVEYGILREKILK